MTAEATEGRTVSPNEGTALAMIAWLGWTISTHELREATASALRTGCQKVLDVESDLESLDMKSADVDGIITRYRNKHRGTMKDQTIETYEQRFRQTVEMYLKWLDGDTSWRPAQRQRASSGSGDAKPARKAAKQAEPKVQERVHQQHEPTVPGMIKYPFPIRPGLQGTITLPEDLTMREAKRIAAFVSTLALEDEEPARAITAGHFHEER